MLKTLVKTRKFNKETYKVYLVQPSYEGEKGYLDMEIEPYVFVETPENCLGYSDTVLFDSKGHGHTSYRYIQPWIVRELEKINKNIMDKINNGLCVPVIEK
jgi:hypothetical protein